MNLCSDAHTGVGTPHRITEEKTSMVGVEVGVGVVLGVMLGVVR